LKNYKKLNSLLNGFEKGMVIPLSQRKVEVEKKGTETKHKN
jgi:hypothetical protein